MNCNNRLDVVDRLCSSLSNDVGEDPIGSSPTWDHCLFIEVPIPWMPEVALSENSRQQYTDVENPLKSIVV